MSPARKETKDKADQPDRAVELRMSAVDSIAEVSKADWDACANPNRIVRLKPSLRQVQWRPARLAKISVLRPPTTRLFRTIFCRRLKRRNRSAAGPVGMFNMF